MELQYFNRATTIFHLQYSRSSEYLVEQTIRGVSPVGSVVAKTIGGVSPVAWISDDVTVLIDEALGDYEVVWAAAGHPHAVFPTSFSELVRCTGAKSMTVGD